MIRGVKFASIPVTDQDRAIGFYTEKVGFRLVTDQPFTDEQRWIELGIPGADTVTRSWCVAASYAADPTSNGIVADPCVTLSAKRASKLGLRV